VPKRWSPEAPEYPPVVVLVSVGDIKMSNLRLLFASFAATASLWKMWKVGHGLKCSKVQARLEGVENHCMPDTNRHLLRVTELADPGIGSTKFRKGSRPKR